MSNPFNIAVTEEKADITRDRLKQEYPRLPDEIINQAIETSSWHTLFRGTNRYNTQVALEHFYTTAVTIVEERCVNSIDAIELLLLDKNRCSDDRVKENDSELVKGIRSIPDGVFRMVMKSARALWDPE